jgi:hypothetical protein
LTVLLVLALTLPAVSLAAAEGSLSGGVVDRLGTPIAGAHVVIIPYERTRPVLLAVTGPNGRWSREGLLAGAYRLIATKLGYAATIEREVVVEEGGASDLSITLSPVEAVSEAGRRNLTWLVRGLSGDVLRLAEGEPQEVARPRTPGLLSSLPLSGRVEIARMMGEGAGPSDSLGGNSAGLSLSGEATRGLSWHLDGHRGEQELSADGVEDTLASDRLRYGVALAQAAGGLWRFEGSLARSTRLLSNDSGQRLAGRAQLVSYSLGWSRSTQSGGLAGLELAYLAAETDLAQRVDSHELLLTRGAYARKLGDTHHLNTRVELTAQNFTRPNGMIYADDLASGRGMLAAPYAWAPASWTLRAAGEHRWEGMGRLSLEPGFDLFTAHGGSLPGLVQPRLGLQLKLDQQTAVGTEITYSLSDATPDTGGEGKLGYGVRLERDLGDIGRVSLAARLNAHRALTQEAHTGRELGPPDFLLLTGEGSSTRELALGLEASLGDVLSGRVQAIVGEADGGLMLVPLGERAMGRGLQELATGSVQYVVTSLGTRLQATETDLDLSYRWADGLTPATAAVGETGYARLDLRLRQALPWSTPLAARVELLLNLRSYLERPLLLAETERGGWSELEPAHHTVTGGVAILF